MVSIHRHEKSRGFSVAIFAKGYPLKKLVVSNGKHSSAWLQRQSSSASGNKGRAQGKVAKSNLISDALLGSLPSMQTCCAPDPINRKKRLCKFAGNFGIFFLKHFGLDHSYTMCMKIIPTATFTGHVMHCSGRPGLSVQSTPAGHPGNRHRWPSAPTICQHHMWSFQPKSSSTSPLPTDQLACPSADATDWNAKMLKTFTNILTHLGNIIYLYII